MKVLITALLAGILFGAGLIVAGMTNPMKVVNFLDVVGPWDPSLALVMGGAFVTTFIGYRLVQRRPRPLFDDRFHSPPPSTDITRSLVVGSVLFGIGWGLSGLCPGPAIAVATMAPLQLLPFGVGLVAGVLGYQFLDERRSRKAAATD
jgi:uncharacterized membrane protein YedE/YeeE